MGSVMWISVQKKPRLPLPPEFSPEHKVRSFLFPLDDSTFREGPLFPVWFLCVRSDNCSAALLCEELFGNGENGDDCLHYYHTVYNAVMMMNGSKWLTGVSPSSLRSCTVMGSVRFMGDCYLVLCLALQILHLGRWWSLQHLIFHCMFSLLQHIHLKS